MRHGKSAISRCYWWYALSRCAMLAGDGDRWLMVILLAYHSHAFVWKNHPIFLCKWIDKTKSSIISPPIHKIHSIYLNWNEDTFVFAILSWRVFRDNIMLIQEESQMGTGVPKSELEIWYVLSRTRCASACCEHVRKLVGNNNNNISQCYRKNRSSRANVDCRTMENT